MISFASLFVGFVLGLVNVQLLASGGVERIELLLDGQPVAELTEPYSVLLDLGCEPSPHELVAVAYDAQGKELDRVRQWINRPRATADASLLLENGAGGNGRFARLAWRALEGEVPVDVEVTFDGKAIRMSDFSRIELPAYDPAQVHFLRAVVRFEEGATAAAELVFGGSRRAETLTELTAVAVELEKGASLPAASELAGWFESRGGEPLEVAAVEDGGTDLVFVQEGSAGSRLRREYGGLRHEDRWDEVAREPTDAGLRFRILEPVGRVSRQSEMVVNVFPSSSWRSRGVGSSSSIAWVVSSYMKQGWRGKNQRIADAVAVAALSAAEANRKRAVVLLLGPDAEDRSLRSPDEVMRFAGRLGVPLRVWSVGDFRSPEAKSWGAEVLVSSRLSVESAVSRLLEVVNRQRIVWLEGAHLPQDVALGPLARGIRLAR
ncbi:MAG: hypothetical protein IPP07_11985 [Holophagales bacterium]|jgi:hypothetical protein|nr:hypothetical protein [Holophagales bacterium]MBK9965573.1 hypothetical protein [Holophagales bacterium]